MREMAMQEQPGGPSRSFIAEVRELSRRRGGRPVTLRRRTDDTSTVEPMTDADARARLAVIQADRMADRRQRLARLAEEVRR